MVSFIDALSSEHRSFGPSLRGVQEEGSWKRPGKKHYNLGKRLALRMEYRLCHISDPFRSDQGLNTHAVLLGISF